MKRFCYRSSYKSVLIFLLAVALSPALADNCGEVDLQQNWSCEDKQEFWFTDQGSRVIPYDWFLYLEKADSRTILSSSENMARYRYIPVEYPTELNRDKLPIGFAKTEKKTDGVYWMGFTCAACHTGKVSFQGKSIIVEGAPAMADYTMFFDELLAAMEATAKDEQKFTRFAKQVLGDNYAKKKEHDLKKHFEQVQSDIFRRQDVNHSQLAYGYARLDALGNIFNQISVFALGLAQNKREPNAPVSYPFLWDTPQHDVVQWNGSVSNSPPGLGPLSRNAGEVLGVFGHLKINESRRWWPLSKKYVASVNLENLGELEAHVVRLFSPVWPESLLGPVADAGSAQYKRGEELFNSTCLKCHSAVDPKASYRKIPIDRDDPDRRIRATMIPVNVIGTDSTASYNFLNNKPETGILQGKRKNNFSGEKFGETALAVELLVNSVIGVIGGHPIKAYKGYKKEDHIKQVQTYDFDPNSYKARPLNGIWATAPYLHNGSVPNLRELLKPADQRVSKFFVGSWQYDPYNVGYVSDAPADGAIKTFLFDASLKGNRNTGHSGPEHGTNLSDEDKDALIEYIKTL